MKTRLKSDNDLPLGKRFNTPDMIIFATSILGKMVNIIQKSFYMNARITHKNVTVRKN